MHDILGTVLPSGAAGLLILPTSGKALYTLEANACTPESRVIGSVAGVIAPTGKAQNTSKLTLSGTNGKETVGKIDVAGGMVEPELVAFSETATESVEYALQFSQAIEVT
ncbi:MAG TPA: hypothetical protein VK691_04440 [Solirubrobacteraceae bacterium]|nr:hypothetical protein [Solirubrobacteraceae bacterium]